MDPLHPETAVPRIKELSKQLDRVLSDLKKATTTGKLAELEREGILVVQEMSLIAPRLHEVVMQTSRQRRHDLAHGVLDEPQDTAVEMPVEKRRSEALAEIAKQTEKISEQVSEIVDTVTEKVEKIVEKSEPTEEKEAVSKKETTTKKRAAKKAKE